MKNMNLNGLTEESCLVIIVEAVNALGWEIKELALKNLTILPNIIDGEILTEIIKIRIEDSTIYLQSEYSDNGIDRELRDSINMAKLIEAIQRKNGVYNEQELLEKHEGLRRTMPIDADEANQHIPKQLRIQNFLSIFKPTKDYFVTPILINLNVIVFVIMFLSGVDFWMPDNESLLLWGANFRPLTLAGELWRLMTSCFLHIGVFHLVLNMYALAYIGALLEPHLGRAKFLTTYLLTGITASAASLSWNDLVISAGASGAIFGMYGVFLALLTTNIINKSIRKSLLTSILSFVGYNLVIGLSAGQGIDNAAHIGGLISGFAMGYMLVPTLRKPDQSSLKWKTMGVMVMLVLSGSILIYNTISDDMVTYNNKMMEFSVMEETALEIYKLPDELSTKQVLAKIKGNGIDQWNKAIKLIDSMDVLDLPEDIVHKNSVLKEYCQLRKLSYELIYKAVTENSAAYDNQLEDYNKQIEAKIESLKKVQ